MPHGKDSNAEEDAMTSSNPTQYQAPQLRVHGSLEALTQGNSTGNYIDATFPGGTPVSQLTFS
jgi:hypothetical protein